MAYYAMQGRVLAQATNAPEYRYLTFDLLTRKVLEEFPMYGVSLSRLISKSATGTCTFKLGTGFFSDRDLIASTIPGKCGMIVLRDEIPVWGGIIWNRTWQSEALSMQMNLMTFESLFSRIRMMSTFAAAATDQTTIFKSLINMMQAQPNNNFNLDLSGILPTGINRDLTLPYYEYHVFQDAIDLLMGQSNAFDWIMDPVLNSDGTVGIKIRTGYPYLGFGSIPITFDYPGQVANYTFPESTADGGTRITFLGAGEGTAMPMTPVWDYGLLNAGYPGWDKIISNKAVDNQVQLDSMAQASSIQYQLPITMPTIEVKLDQNLGFTEWASLGLPFNLYMQDERFPDGYMFPSRMIGWTLTPGSSESVELLKLVLEGDQFGG